MKHFVEAGRQHYGGDLTGKWDTYRGLGGMGGAQPLAAVMAGACCLAVECNPDSIDFRLRTNYVDERADTLDEALELIDRWTKAGSPNRLVCWVMRQMYLAKFSRAVCALIW